MVLHLKMVDWIFQITMDRGAITIDTPFLMTLFFSVGLHSTQR